jgi:hypothetical protein
MKFMVLEAGKSKSMVPTSVRTYCCIIARLEGKAEQDRKRGLTFIKATPLCFTIRKRLL